MTGGVLAAGARTAGIALVGMGAAAGVGMTKAISLGMDAAETYSKFTTVFGSNAEKMEAWAADMSGEFGITTKSLQDAASTFGVFGQAAGIANRELPAFSKELAQAGLDLSSFYNVPVEDTFLALRSGLAGESEPMRQFGVFMSDAALNAFMLANGLKGTFSELSEGEKVTVRQQFIMANLGKAHGDLDRTSAGLANQWRALKGRATELATSLGTMLTPAANNLVSSLNDRLQPVVTRLSLLAPRFGKALEESGPVAAVAKLDQMTKSGGELSRRFITLIHYSNRLKAIMGAGGLVQALDEAGTQFPALKGPIDAVREVLGNLHRIVTVAIVPAFRDVMSVVPDLLTPLGQLRAVLKFVADNAETLRPILVGLTAGFVAYKIATTAANIVTAAGNAILFLRTAATAGLAAAQVGATTATGTLAVGTGILNAVMTANPIMLVVVAIAALVAGLITAWNKSEAFREAVLGAWDSVKAFGLGVKTTLGELVHWFSTLPDKFAQAAGDLWAFLKDSFRDAVNGIISWWNNLELTFNPPGPGSWTMGTPDIPMLAKGGPLAAGQAAIVGERGPELFLPDRQVVTIPMLASGGSLAAGRAAIVGERGPELFIPDVGGRVVPHHIAREVIRSVPGEGSITLNGPLIGTVNASSEVDVERAVLRTVRRLERDRAERGHRPRVKSGA